MNCNMSIVTTAYVEEFYAILDTMIDEMTAVCPNNSISYNFIMRMIPHHMAAINMSKKSAAIYDLYSTAEYCAGNY